MGYLNIFQASIKMTKTNMVFFVALISSFICFPIPAEAVLEKPLFDLEFAGGSRLDQLDWNIAGNIDGNNPNILSELTWEDLEISQVSSQGVFTFKPENSLVGLAIRGKLNYGEIHDGKNQDSDYAGDNRTFEWSRSNNSADDGDVWDLTLGFGPVFSSRDNKTSAKPYVGYSYHEQNLTIQNGFQTYSNQANADLYNPAITVPPVGPIAGLNSTYEARWYSFLVGALMEFAPNNNFSLHTSVELHAGTYDAKANWNLRDTFQHPISFRHESDEAAGILVNFGLKSGVKNLLFNFDLNYQKWKAEDGTDKTYFTDGTIVITRLNEVNWESFSIMAGFTVRF